MFIISTFLVLWYFLGNSPTFEQMILAFLLTAVFGISVNIDKIGTELRFLRKSFHALAKDFKEHLKKET